MLLDIRFYDEVLNKFFYASDDGYGEDENGLFVTISINSETQNPVCYLWNEDYSEERTLVQFDRFTGFSTYGEKIYENDLLHRIVNCRLWGDIEDHWIHDWTQPIYRKDYGGFFANESMLYHQFENNFDSATHCRATHFKKVGNAYQNKELIEMWMSNNGEVENANEFL